MDLKNSYLLSNVDSVWKRACFTRIKLEAERMLETFAKPGSWAATDFAAKYPAMGHLRPGSRRGHWKTLFRDRSATEKTRQVLVCNNLLADPRSIRLWTPRVLDLSVGAHFGNSYRPQIWQWCSKRYPDGNSGYGRTDPATHNRSAVAGTRHEPKSLQRYLHQWDEIPVVS